MKTAMQEAIELVKKYDNREIPFKVLLLNLELLLNKEKEQIMEAYKNSINTILLLPSGIKSQKGNSEDYYNQTYNQNK